MPRKGCSDQSDWYESQLKPHEEMLRNWLKSRYGDLCDADDVLQEALMRVLKAQARKPIEAPKAFFFALARNIAVDSIRKSRVSSAEPLFESEAMDILDEDEDVAETVARNQELSILTRAIQSLPTRCRRIFTLSRVYGMTYKQIAREMGISVNTVAAQVTIGLSKVEKFMNSRVREQH